MKILLKSLLIFFIFIFSSISGYAQDSDTIAIVPPFLNKEHRPEWENSIQLVNHHITIFLYQNAAAVYMESVFLNKLSSPMEVEIELPSTGYTIVDPDGRKRDAKELLGLMTRVEGTTIQPEIVQWQGDIWFSLKLVIGPNEIKNIKTFFWMPTLPGRRDEGGMYDSLEIPRGDRSLLVLLSHASEWCSTINDVKCMIVLQDNLMKPDSIFTFQPIGCKITDTSMYWQFSNIEPTSYEDIVIRYSTDKEETTALNTYTLLNEYIIKNVYPQLVMYHDLEKNAE